MALYSGSRQSLDSGVGMSRAVDGIKMKINTQFLPPPKVTLPSNYETGNPTEILFMEYDYDLERKVLAWCNEDKRQEAIKRAQQEAERAKQEIELAEQETTIQGITDTVPKEHDLDTSGDSEELTYVNVGSSNIETDSSIAFPGAMSHSLESRNSPIEMQAEATSENVAARETSVSPMEVSSSVHSQNVPKSMAPSVDSHGILVPTRVAPAIPVVKDGENNKVSFDLADFEQEQDPFDKLELKVLNDMAELNKVLQTAHPATSVAAHQPVPVTAFPQTIQSNTAATGAPNVPPRSYSPARRLEQYENVFPSHRNNPVSTAQAPVPAPRTGHRPMPAPRNINVKNVEYPDMGSTPPVSSSNAVAKGQFGLSFLSNGGVKFSSQTNVPSQSTSTNASNNSNTGYAAAPGFPEQRVDGVKYNHSSYPNMDNFYATDFSAKLQSGAANGRSKTPDHQYQEHTESGGSNNVQMGAVNPFSQANVNGNMNGMRPARSVPDLTSVGKSGETRFPKSHTPPPTSERTATPLAQPTQNTQNEHAQQWLNYWQRNTYQPPGETAATTNPPLAAQTNVALTVALRPNTAQSLPISSLPDPYTGMEPQKQQFINNIADMGFPRSRVARTVSRLGEDPKQVIDHLVLIDRLTEKGASGDDVETALQAFEQDQEKAELYLNLISQFRELGFAEHRIKEVLVTCKLDENAALDQLTAVS